MKGLKFAFVLSLFALVGTGCNIPAQSLKVESVNNLNTSSVAVVSIVALAPSSTKEMDLLSKCNFPPIWGEVNNIFKDCQLKEIEKGSGYSQTFNPEDGNGIFDYCNTLTFRHYQSVKGELYTYEKIRYTHYPNSEIGEYRIDKKLFDSITNSRPCVSTYNRFDKLSDDDLSSDLFPSKNYLLDQDLRDINILPSKFSVKEKVLVDPPQKTVPKKTIPISAPNGTYENTAGNTVPSPYYAPSAPAGASAICGDGTYSFSQSRRGTCSHHGGVDEWL